MPALPAGLARREPGREEGPLARVVGEGERPAVLDGRLRPSAKPAEKIGAGGGQEMIFAQRRDVGRVERGEPDGPCARPIATARFSSTTGDGATSASAR